MSKKEERKKLILLDAHAIIHRAYHALPDFSSRKGEPTGALYGLSAMLLKMVQDLHPDYIVACYDLPEPTFRHEVYKEYKGGRAKTDEELVVQLIRSRDIFSVFNIPIYEHGGFEADDMLGTIVEQVKGNTKLDVVIASGDMDTLQLVKGKKVQVYTLRKGIQDTVMYDEKAVTDRFGFKPEFLVDYKGLRGDPSDNIIGIPGIGEKTATTLIQHFGTIENIYKKLAKDETQFEKAGITPRIRQLLRDNEEEALFSKMLATIRRDAPITFNVPGQLWREALDPKDVLTLFADLNFRTLSRRVESMFSVESSDIPEEAEVIETMSFRDERKLIIALWILHSDITAPAREDILQFTKTKTLSDAKKKLEDALKKEKLDGVFNTIELPLIPVIDAMQERGITLDLAYLKKLSKEYHTELSKLEKKIWEYAGDTFNINSPRQLSEVLFDKLELKIKNQKKTSTGQRSTRESELEKLRGEHSIIENILSYRELQKLLSTYIDNLPLMVDKKDRLHTVFMQTGTTTGRMSSHNPNLQNIPIRTELGRNIRKAFVASTGFELVSLDYSQIELRVAAFLSGDRKLINIFRSGGDVHRAVAAEVFGVLPEEVDAEMRRRAKVINFGIIYGMGVNALRANLGTNRQEAQQFYNDYFAKFKGLANYLDETKARASRRGYTETYFGRKRYFEGINSSLPFVRAQAERMAINAPIQGTQADIIKIAMRRIYDHINKNKLEGKIYLLLQVHDELIFEIKKGMSKEIATACKKIMESVLTGKETAGVPIIAEVASGPNWSEMKELSI